MEHKESPTNNDQESTVQCSEAPDEGGIPVSDEEDNNLSETDQTQTMSDQKEVPSDKTQNEPLVAPINAVDEMSVAEEISKYIHSNRINLAELENSIDMWAICDAISAAHSGLPDSLLRAAFLLVLEGFYSFAQNNPWMRKHLDQLTRMWKREMLSEKSTSRPTKFVSSSAEITVPSKEKSEQSLNPPESSTGHSPTHSLTERNESGQNGSAQGDADAPLATDESAPLEIKPRRQRRQAAKRKRALAVMMGVGQMLKQARRTLNTETGQLEVDEDEFGNFSIGGSELTFESWGKLTAIKQSDVVRIEEQQQQQQTAAKHPQKQRVEGSANKQQNGGGTSHAEVKTANHKLEKLRQPTLGSAISTPTTTTNHANESNRAKVTAAELEGMAQRYPTVAEVEIPSSVDEDQRVRATATLKASAKKERKAAKLERKQKRLEEKDEGELSSSESEEPTSSEEEEESTPISAEEGTVLRRANVRSIPSHERRHTRRTDEQKQGVSSAQNLQALLKKCFELRGRIVGKLSIGQKAMFRDCLNKSISGTLQQQPQQSQLQQLVHSVTNSMADGNGDQCPMIPNM